MLSFSPTSVFSSVDLPTFGLPTIATKPQRPVSVSVLLTGQHQQHRRSSFLFRSAAALSVTGRMGILLSNFAIDGERLLVVASLHGPSPRKTVGVAPCLVTIPAGAFSDP